MAPWTAPNDEQRILILPGRRGRPRFANRQRTVAAAVRRSLPAAAFSIEALTQHPRMTANEFLDLLRRSQLVEEDQLTKFLGSHEDADKLANTMVGAGVLTQWQAEKLLEGKFKGFLIGYYRILDYLGRTSASRAYLAKHTVTKRKFRMDMFTPKTGDHGPLRFTVTDYEE